MQLANVRLLVTRFKKCFVFYRDVMGFAVTTGDEGGPYAAFSVGETGVIGLFDRVVWSQSVGEIVMPFDFKRFDREMLVLAVDDVDTAFDRLKGRGARVAYKPADRPLWGTRTAHFRDPDGHLIELSAPLKEGSR